ncbi:16S rRNA (cytidine(1402)-2'-O)-methyltransferase [Aestuariibacter halophilus]|uniref:Ribosomal RNA small subunit methyltransferase I n=1 Tax=Fluctibacter halophilus TaxID=226011 RepID=A0ABS8GCR2_9ALTE|nr:16S rRNA (cytidine(1402)-2'-O)-methyltransferase [Aestuariibacter halophilus]MCC2618298.1 16S rRNA (cytidine(1402)-2'-O)-methyltransferase [Aestuariibacter halophilus]
MTTTGTLFIVPTPIGNLEDITQRAVRVLSEVDVVAAEDTRHSARLMQHLGINPRMLSLHDHNESQRAVQLIAQLQQGHSVALISDAGTPLISDPGYALVSQCRAAGVAVVPLPGACAAITALSAAGLPTDRFRFEGFLPVKAQARQQQLESLLNETATSVYYEAPRRIEDTLQAVVEVLGSDRAVVIAKELTKAFETFFSGSAAQALEWLQADPNHQRGEFVLMIGGQPGADTGISDEAAGLLKALMAELPLKKAAGIVAKHCDLKKNALYEYGLTLNQKG